MITDQGLILATNEGPPGGGLAGAAGPAGALGIGSVALGLDPSSVGALINRSFNDIGGGSRLDLHLAVGNEFNSATFGATLELQLVSIPISASKLVDAGAPGAGKFLSIIAAATVATDQFTTGGTPGGSSLVAHGLPVGAPVFLTGITTLTGAVANTIYYVIPDTADSFKLATSLANAKAGVAVDLTGVGQDVIVNLVPTIHGSTGSLPLYSAGVPTNQGPLRAGQRLVVPLRPLVTLPPNKRLAPGGFVQPFGAGPTSGLIGANPQHFYHLRYIFSNALTSGTLSAVLALTSASVLQHPQSGVEVL